jgi:hypothetical protein
VKERQECFDVEGMIVGKPKISLNSFSCLFLSDDFDLLLTFAFKFTRCKHRIQLLAFATWTIIIEVTLSVKKWARLVFNLKKLLGGFGDA